MLKSWLGLVAAAASLASCGGGGSDETRENILIVGSSTIYPFTTAVAERFVQENQGMSTPVVESTGTTAGFERFCAGTGDEHPDIVDASRRMTRAEFDACRNGGVTDIIEIQIGVDGVTFAQSPVAQPLNLTPRQIYEALAANPYGEPNRAENWSDVDSSLPARPILIYGPPETSGTRDSLGEQLLQVGCDTNGEMRALAETDPRAHGAACRDIREDGKYVDSGEDDARITDQVVVNPGAVGIFGFSFFQDQAETLRAVPINGVTPSEETIGSGDYAGSRPLFIYVKAAHLESVSGLRQFVAEYVSAISPDGYLAQIGLVAAPEAVRATSASAVENRVLLTAASFE